MRASSCRVHGSVLDSNTRVLEDAVDLIVAPMHTKSNTYQEERVTLSTQNGLLNFVLTA